MNNLLERNIAEASDLLINKPMQAVSAERFLILNEIKDTHGDLPMPLRFSKFLSILLSRVSVPLESYDLIAGRGVDRELTDDEERDFAAFLEDKSNPYGKVFLGSGHCTYSWDMLIREGLCGLKRRAEAARLASCDEDKKIFYRAICEIYTAIEEYMLRYSKKAEEMGMTSVAENVKNAATRAPESFYEALQLLWTVTFINCTYVTPNPTLTVGRLDKILYPLYIKDIECGRLTKDKALEYITDYYCKHNLNMGRGEHQVGDATNSTTFRRILNFDAPQYLILSGYDESGKCCANELTELFAEAIVPSFKNPVVVVRYTKDLDKKAPELWRILTEKALQSSSLMFYNDENVIPTLERMGVPKADAVKYEHFGCNWCSLGADSSWMWGGPGANKYVPLSSEEKAYLIRPYMRMHDDIGWPRDLVSVMRELAEKPEGEVTIDDIYDGFFKIMADFIDQKLAYLSRELATRKRRPAAVITYGDCFLEQSLERGECISAGAKYHFEMQAFQMFATVVDCIIVADKLVFLDKVLTLTELLDAAECNFIGKENILALCKSVPKYGSDTPHSNAHVKRLSHRACELVVEKSKPYLEKEGLLLTPCMQSDTWHLKNGIRYGATPDGRRANTPFSQNSAPSNGACTSGITGMFNSMLNLPHDGLVSGALNLDIDKNQFPGENGRAVFAALLATYFNNGGLHAQVSSLDPAMLEAAREHPNEHRDIRVRVTGYSGIFVDMCKKLQDDVIERFK